MRRNLLGTLYMCVAVAAGVAPTGASAQTLAGGYQHSVVLKSDGTVWVAGENSDGQLGDDTTTDRRTPIAVSGLTGITAVAAGRVHSLALDSTGTLRLWGDNSGGQIGDNTSTDRRVPTTSSLSNVAEIAAGEYHTVVRLTNGHVYAWGSNSSGQLGIGSTTQSRVPVLVTTGAIAIGAGHSHTLVVKSDGTVWGAGTNGNAQLGDTTTTSPRTSLVQMAGVANATAVAGGQYHSLVRLADGTLKACGYNAWGQLGDGSNQQRATAVAVGTLTDVTAIAVGERHNIVRKSDGTVWVWGYNYVGQLGDGTTTNRLSPWQVSTLSSIASVAAGDGHSLATDTSGVVFTWGGNDGAQLADGTLVNRWAPASISGAGYDWPVAMPTFSVTAGQYTSDRSVVVAVETPGATIHYTQNGVDPTESDPTVASGGVITVSISQTLKAKAWKAGMPESAVASAAYELKVVQPTYSPAAGTSTTPRTVTISTTTPDATIRYTIDTTEPTVSSPLYTAPIEIATTTTLKAVAFKTSWTQSTTTSGVYTMNFGTLAAPTADPAAGGYTGQATVSLTAAAGATIRYTTNTSDPTTSSPIYTAPLTFGVTTTLKAKAFQTDYTQSATLTQVYTITTATPVISLASGDYAPGTTLTITNPDPAATMRLTTNGATPTATDPIVPSGWTMSVGNFTLKVRAFKANALDSAVAEATYTSSGPLTAGTISAGGSHSLAATPDGRVYAWGSNGWNQLGDGTPTQRNWPTLLPTLSGITKVAAGSSHSLAATHDGRLYAWGSNGSGRLGDGTTTTRSTPVLITGAPANVTAIAAGESFSLALSGGSVYAWGLGTSGQLGLGSTSSVSTPTIVPGLSNVIAIAAGGTHSLAVTGTGALYAWGANGSSQIGDGSTTQRNSPTLVALSNVASVAAGSIHSLALTTTGEVWVWGAGGSGQLGLGNTSSRTTPGQITGLSALRIEAGAVHSGAVRSDGLLVLWGSNGSGQLGDGSITTRTAPTVVAAPANLAVLTLGDSHTMAATADGAVWTWGAGSSGQLGQGTTSSRSTPDAISAAAFAWRVATPAFSVTPGQYTSDRSVIVTVDTPGATIHYTQNGVDPTESDPTITSGGTILVSTSQTLKAKAWKAGMPESGVAIAVYELKVVQPTYNPAAGTSTTPRTVTIGTTTPGATIRYTIDTTEPTASSPLYTTPIDIATTTTLKAVAFKPSWTQSTTNTGIYTMNFGTLSPPAADPVAGGYTGQVTVSLSAAAGVTIRYTTNNSDPTTSSTLYTAPLPFGVTTTLKGKAFHSDYTQSATLTQVYTITTATPVISLASGDYAPGTTLTITNPDPAATMRLTTNGATPTATDPIVASGSTMSVGNFTLKVRAFKANAVDSAVVEATYTLSGPLTAGTLSAGANHSLAVTPDGRVYVWGTNGSNQLGDGTPTQRNSPTLLPTLSGITKVAAGSTHSLAATHDGRVYAWGSNGNGRLGDGTTTNRSTPVLITGAPANVTAIAAGESFSLALSGGSVYAWGLGSSGQLGLGPTSSVSTPTIVPGLSNVIAIAAGGTHSLAVTGAGELYAWGANSSGQIGDAFNTQRNSPTLVALSNVASVAAGSIHSLALTTTGEVWAWGAGWSGQLGLGNGSSRNTPGQITGLSALRITAGSAHSGAVRMDGVLVMWGGNGSGQLGDGGTSTRWAPTVAAAPVNLAVLSAGGSHTIAAPADGEVWTWGYGGNGQLGQGTTTSRTTPEAISDPAFAWRVATPTLSVATGTYNTDRSVVVAVETPGATIHYTLDGNEPTTSDATLVSGGTLLVDRSLTLKAKAFKTGMPVGATATAVYTMSVAQPTVSPSGGTFTTPQSVSMATATAGSTLRYTLDGSEPGPASTAYSGPMTIGHTTTVKVAGFKTGWSTSSTYTVNFTMNFGQLATPTADVTTGSYVGPVTVTLSAATMPPGATIRYTTNNSEPGLSSTIYTQPLVIGATTTLKAKTFHPDYQTSPMMTHVYTLTTAAPVFSLSAGTHAPGATVVITNPDPAATIRITLNGNDPTSTDASVPSGWTMVAGTFTLKARAFKNGNADSAVTQAAYTLSAPLITGALDAGAFHAGLSTPDGLLYMWGGNTSGQIGDGMTGNATPVKLIQTLTGVTELALGYTHTLAKTFDGRLYAWGANSAGQLGDGTHGLGLPPQTRPVEITSLAGVIAIAAGGNHSMALTPDGDVYTWGSNNRGQLGLDSTTTVSVPTLVPGLTDVVAIAAGEHHSLAVTSTGQLYAWGSNIHGRLGLGPNSNDRLTPMLVAGISGVASVSAGDEHSLALTDTGAVYAWGNNYHGQLGLGTTTAMDVPTLVPNLSAVAVRASYASSVALRDDGVLVAWGWNYAGQLGDGTTTSKFSPTAVLNPGSVALIDANGAFAIAATPSGDIRTWGGGTAGQLGDGTTSSRSTPQVVMTHSGSWGPTSAPTPNLAPGTFNTPQSVTVTVATPDAAVHYTTNGAAPTEADPFVLTGGTIPINQTTTLRLRAWAPGRGPSAIVSRAYTLAALAPVFTPAQGQYTSAQNVSLSTPTPGATVRYTTNGSDPTEASTAYSAPFAVNTLTTVKARAFLANWLPSPITTVVYSFSYGTLGTPVAAPASGTYDTGQLVTLSAAPSVTIRYTIDGSTPTETSSVYTQPFSIGITGTRIVNARAFQLDYTPSAVMTATYTVNTAPPPSSTLTTLVVTPQEARVALDGTVPLTATGTYADGSIRDLTASASWSSSATAVATVTAGGVVKGVTAGSANIEATVGSLSASTSLTVVPSRFTRTGNMVTPRMQHTAVLLTSGTVVIEGGNRAGFGETVNDEEVYDPATGKWTNAATAIIGRTEGTATRLADGRILYVGGTRWQASPFIQTAQLLGPGGVSIAGTTARRRGHTATLLQDGRVLIAGGYDDYYFGSPINTAEIYDPVTNTFTAVGPMVQARDDHTATLLENGKVLLVGGSGLLNPAAELYDPATNTFAATGSLNVASASHSATRLANGTVLIVGGHNQTGNLARAEIYDPYLGTFVLAGDMTGGRSLHDGVLLHDGTVLIVNGGGEEANDDGRLAELYDPVTHTFAPAGHQLVRRLIGTATMLIDGRVLLAGGSPTDPTTEVYNPGFGVVQPISLSVTPKTATTTVGMVRQFTATDELGLPRGDASWSVSDPVLATVTVADGRAHVEPLAAGVVTVTASIGSVSDSAELTIVPMNATFEVGASIWGLPPLAGFQVGQIVEASPSSDGPDFYTVSESGTEAVIRAIRLDGQEMWRLWGPPTNRNVAPDAFGGLLVTSYNTCDLEHPMVISNIDKTGRTAWSLEGQSACTADAPQFAIRKDGSIVISAPGNTSGFPPLMIVDGHSGGVIQTPTIPPSTFVDMTGATLIGYSRIGAPTVDTDGSAYVLYEVRDLAYPPSVNWATLKLLKIAANGTETTTQIHHTTDDENLFPGQIIPDGEGGVIVQWIEAPAPVNITLPANPLKAARVTAGGGVTQYDLPVEVQQLVKDANGLVVHPSLVLGENGKAFVTYDRTIASFNLASGSVNWVDTPTQKVTIVSAAAGNDLVAKTTSGNGTEQVVRYSESGTPAPESWTGELVSHYRTDLWLSATNDNWVNVRAASTIAPSTSVWQTPLQKNLRKAHPGFETNYGRIDLETAASPTYVFDTYMKTFAGVNAGSIAEAHFPDGPLDAKGDRVMFKLKQVPLPLQPSFEVSVVRLDPANHAFAAETEPTHHPLFGWRYWRVFSLSPGVLRIETGAFDRENRHWFPPFYLRNWLAFHYLGRKDQTDMWRQYFEHIRDDLPNAAVANQDLINGTWGWDYKYIMTQVCGAPPLESGFCAPIP